MKFAAIGRHEALLHTIDMLVEAGHQLSYILTAKEAPEYSAGVADFERKGCQLGVPVYVTPRLTPKWVAKMRQHAVDIAVSLNFPTVIGQDAIGAFPFGVLNAHGGDLPRYRGNACQAWALINAEPEIGLCVHKMVGGELDSGDVIAKDMLPVDHHTRIRTVAQWIEEQTPKLFRAALEQLARDPQYVLYRQTEDPRPPLRCFPRRPEDGRIDWSRTAKDVVRHINASGPPYAGAFFEYESLRYRVYEADWVAGGEYLAIPGQVVARNQDGSVDIACGGDGYCRLSSVDRVDDEWLPPALFIKSVRDRLS